MLFSGGLDSTTCLAIARAEGYEPYLLSFRYSQRHDVELQSAAAVRDYYGIGPERHRVVDLGRVLGGSALTGSGEIPLDRSAEAMAEEIPSTYVPARNIVFLSFSASYGEEIEAERIYLGVNAIDYSGYPDCRPEFIQAFEEVLRVGTKAGVEGHPLRVAAPLLRLSKAAIVRRALELGAPLHLTHSCYQGTRPACGRCDSCLLRIEGFRAAGAVDPIPYALPIDWGK